MKKILLILPILCLTGCAFNDALTKVNSGLETTNKALAGDLPSASTVKNQATTKVDLNDGDSCASWIKQAREYDNKKGKIFSNDPKEQVRIENENKKNISSIKYKIFYNMCPGYDDPDLGTGKDLLERTQLEDAERRINANKSKKRKQIRSNFNLTSRAKFPRYN